MFFPQIYARFAPSQKPMAKGIASRNHHTSIIYLKSIICKYYPRKRHRVSEQRKSRPVICVKSCSAVNNETAKSLWNLRFQRDFGPSEVTRTPSLHIPNGGSNQVLQMEEAHLPVFAPFGLVSGGVVHTVSGCSGGRCGQRCGPYRELPWSGPKTAPRARLYRNSDCPKSQVILPSQATVFPTRQPSAFPAVILSGAKNPFPLPG